MDVRELNRTSLVANTSMIVIAPGVMLSIRVRVGTRLVATAVKVNVVDIDLARVARVCRVVTPDGAAMGQIDVAKLGGGA